MMQPLVIRAEMANGVAIDPRFTLDGLLAAVIIRDPELKRQADDRRAFKRLMDRHGRAVAKNVWRRHGKEPPATHHHLPLSVWGHGHKHGLWVFCASYGVPDEPWEYDTVHYTKRIDANELQRWVEDGPKRVELGKGAYKSEYIALPLIVSSAFTWYAHGHADMVRQILGTVRYFGKKRSQGYGRVLRWEVEVVDKDSSVWDGDRVNRPIPSELLELMGVEGEFDYGYYSYRPPYHDRRNLTRCVMAGTRSQKVPVSGQKTICESDEIKDIVADAFGSG